MKRSQYHMSISNCKLKQQWDITTHLLRIPNIQKPTNTKCGWRCRAIGTFSLLVGMQNDRATLKDNLLNFLYS